MFTVIWMIEMYSVQVSWLYQLLYWHLWLFSVGNYQITKLISKKNFVLFVVTRNFIICFFFPISFALTELPKYFFEGLWYVRSFWVHVSSTVTVFFSCMSTALRSSATTCLQWAFVDLPATHSHELPVISPSFSMQTFTKYWTFFLYCDLHLAFIKKG